MADVQVRWAVKKHDERFGWRLLAGYSDDFAYILDFARVRRELGEVVKIVQKKEIITEMEVDLDGKQESAGGGDQPGENG